MRHASSFSGTTTPPTPLRNTSPLARTTETTSERRSGTASRTGGCRARCPRSPRHAAAGAWPARGAWAPPCLRAIDLRGALAHPLPAVRDSVTYGLTSEPQFLQTTKRSGWLTFSRRVRERAAGVQVRQPSRRRSRQRPRGSRDWPRRRRSGAAPRCRARADRRRPPAPPRTRDPPRDRARRSTRRRASSLVWTRSRLGQVDQLALEAVAGREPLVLVEHLVRVMRQLTAGLEVLR